MSYTDGSHNDWPVHINKSDDEKQHIIRESDDADDANRVYRAPAYYMNKTMDKAYFNIYAAFVDEYKTSDVHHNMTAIDFTGNNDNTYTTNSQDAFYTPYLDYEGLNGISLSGLTPNLLVYADPTNDGDSYNVLLDYLTEPTLAYDSQNDGKNYYRVEKAEQTPRCHLVDKTSEGYKATHDHFLVDKENFNAPIAYTYAENQYMWYQRIPDRFADGTGKGWDVVCLPFTAGLVTTHQKGEITHFYGGSKKMHEYWLRELNGVAKEGSETRATFARPEAGTADYEATNDFLYKYYYSKYDDENTDSYQDYYKSARMYEDYAYLTAATPYIVAFPGERYYEFDMSGEFAPEHTGGKIDKLDRQVVTMVSENNATIAVTDDEENRRVTKKNYHFIGTYQKETPTTPYYKINSAGNSFETGTGETIPFRGYITTSSSAPPRRIFISGATEDEEPAEDIANRGLTIYGKNEAIYIESTLDYEATVIIHSLSGKVVKRLTIQPMSKEVVPVSSRGVYIVNRQKIAVL